MKWKMRMVVITLAAAARLAQAEGSAGANAQAGREPESIRNFTTAGVVKRVDANGRTVVIAHEAIDGYMPAMTMPFRVKEQKDLAGVKPGDAVSFRLQVTDTESWVDQVSRREPTGTVKTTAVEPPRATTTTTRAQHPLMSCQFTNELGQAASLSDFRGQALAITFFFTRCPIPEYCPRLSKTFQEAVERLKRRENGPTNWHFLSVSFDPEFDTPATLKAYAESYHYDPRHWSFLTGPRDRITELAGQSNVKFEWEAGSISHNFRTLVIDAQGRLQMIFPMSGDFSAALVDEVVKAAGATGGPAMARRD